MCVGVWVGVWVCLSKEEDCYMISSFVLLVLLVIVSLFRYEEDTYIVNSFILRVLQIVAVADGTL